MIGKTHAAAGILCGIALSAVMETKTGVECSTYQKAILITAGAVGSLFPDIDMHNSSVGQKSGILSILANLLFGHRGLTHTPFAFSLLSLAGISLYHANHSAIYAVTGFLCGYLSHLVLDSLNPAGIPLAYPFTKKKRSVAKIRTGGITEAVIRLGLYSAIAINLL